MSFFQFISEKTHSNVLNFLTRYGDSSFDQREALRGNLFFYIIRSRPASRVCLSLLGGGFALTGMAVAYLQKSAIDALTLAEPVFKTAAVFFTIAFAVLCFNKVLEVIVRIIGLRESNIVETWLSEAMYAKALNLHYEKRHEQSTGQTIALMANHLTMVSFFFTELFPPLFTSLAAVLLAPLGMSFILNLNPLAVYGVVLFSLVSCFIFAIRSSNLFQAYKIIDEDRLGHINEWLRNIRALRSLSWIPFFEKRIFAISERFTRQRIKMTGWAQFMNSFAEALPHLINFAGLATLLYFRDEATSPGELFGLLWILGVFLTGPLKALPWIFVISLDAYASMLRIQNFLSLDEAHHPTQAEQKHTFSLTHETAIEIKNLRLRLGEQDVLKDIDLKIKTGEFICIVGPVGAGKSQILSSLVLASPCEFASYRLFGQDITVQDKMWAQTLFTLAPQDSFTLGVSLSKNVHFSFSESPEDQEAARTSLALAAYDKDLEQFQHGLQTELGEYGLNLSGGQRQRLALARAHFFTRPIILLDDSLSAVDQETEELLLENLIFGDWRHKTRILVTHRLSVLPQCDRILFIENGKITAAGPWSTMIQEERFKNFIDQAENGTRK